MSDPGQFGLLLLQQGPLCVWILDAESRFRYAAGNALALFARPAAELPGRSLAEIFDEDNASAWMRRVEQVLHGESFFLRERSSRSNLIYGITLFPLRSPEGAIILAGGLAQDITPLATAEHELRSTALRILRSQEAERGRLSRFLHDDVGQCLSGAGLQLDLLRMDLEEAEPHVSARTAEIQHLLEGVMARVREYSYELNPAIVERAGLSAAMDRLVGRSRREFTGTIRLMADSAVRFPPPVGAAVYRIAQEALQNAIQHSGCSLVEVILKSTKFGPALEVRDNGKGFDPEDIGWSNRGLGLLVMEYYAAQGQLQLRVSGERGKGTAVRAVYAAGAAVEG